LFLKSLILIKTILVLTSNFGIKNDSVAWCARRKLNWKDFNLTLERDGAAAPSNVVFTSTETSTGILIGVKATFLSNEAVANPNDTTRRVLEHEQKHFDITEIVARKIRRYLTGRDVNFKNVDAVYDELLKMADEIDTLNERYDSETDHSRDGFAQLKWNDYIASELKALEKYAVDCKPSSP
jgi:hypothetical protein